LADKILVLSAMFTLVNRDIFWIVPVLIIAVREVGISMYRVVVGAKGVSMPASKLAKYKTLFQQLSVGFAVFPFISDHADWLWLSLLWLSVVLTAVSGAQYIWRARRAPAV
jgi:CDP-diacylglycerol--glycerol-3-phosphate 3-phosphatidyltransferase